MEAGRLLVSTTYDFYKRGIIVDSVVSGDYPIMNALSKHIFQYIKASGNLQNPLYGHDFMMGVLFSKVIYAMIV